MKTYKHPCRLSMKDEFYRIHFTSVNSKFTFDNFIESDCNKVAQIASQQSVNCEENVLYNPLLILGNIGTGKTHLSNAIYNDFQKRFEECHVFITTGYYFHQHYHCAVQQSNKIDFFKFYEKQDILIIDDIDYLIGKDATCTALVQIIDDFVGLQKQIVLTADMPFIEPFSRNKKLNSRVWGGVIVQLHEPSMDLKIKLLKLKLENSNVAISDESLSYIAEHLISDIRKLEGCINTIVLHASILNQEVDIEFINSIYPITDIEIHKILETL